jgi:hypothetical protein
MSETRPWPDTRSTSRTCGKCNALAAAKVTNGKSIINVCPAHLAQFLKWDWQQVWTGARRC